MDRQFHENAYPELHVRDFGTAGQFQVNAYNGGRVIVIGDIRDVMLRQIPGRVKPLTGTVDLAIHGLPGRFIEAINNPQFEIPASVVVQLLESVSVIRGMPLRLLTCHATELPLAGPSTAGTLAAQWGGPVTGPNGILRIASTGVSRIDLIDWVADAVNPGKMIPDNPRVGGGQWLTFP